MQTCQRCSHQVSWTNDTVTVFGGLKAHLCTGCINACELSARALPVYDTWLRYLARVEYYEACATAHQPKSEAAYYALKRWQVTIAQEAVPLMQAWLDTPLVAPMQGGPRGTLMLQQER